MKLLLVSFAFFAALCLTFSSCLVSSGCSLQPVLHGSGVASSETRDAHGFRNIEVVGSTAVTATVGGGGTTVIVEADDNLIGYITTEVHGDTLRVSLENGSYSFNVPAVVRVTLPELASVTILGSANALVTGLDGGSFASTIKGSGDVRADGRVELLEASVQGSGDMELAELEARDVRVYIAGSGNASVRATMTLEAEIRGSGDVIFGGDPVVSGSVHGSGSVRKR